MTVEPQSLIEDTLSGEVKTRDVIIYKYNDRQVMNCLMVDGVGRSIYTQ